MGMAVWLKVWRWEDMEYISGEKSSAMGTVRNESELTLWKADSDTKDSGPALQAHNRQ